MNNIQKVLCLCNIEWISIIVPISGRLHMMLQKQKLSCLNQTFTKINNSRGRNVVSYYGRYNGFPINYL